MTETAKQTRYSLCVSTDCISKVNCKNLQQITYTAYQIAKAACTYSVSEVIVLEVAQEKEESASISTNSPIRADSLLLASFLQYFVTPPYLVKSVFESNKQIDKKDFEVAKRLPKIPMLPFMKTDQTNYREGMSILKHRSTRKKTKSGKVKKMKKQDKMTKYVNIGGVKMVELNKEIPINVRVTVDLKKSEIISPLEAYGRMGTNNCYGYQVRVAKNIQSVFTESGFPDGYDKALFANSGEYFPKKKEAYRSSVDQWKGNETEEGNYLLVVTRWKDLVDSTRGTEINPVQMFDGWMEIPVSRAEDGCMIALCKAFKGNP
ncbi:hypothetical protein FOA43_004080 [Brettanomyces nanus]|uniref:Uncharacterized protein n=1 Tax=Eeniella nana TaxID=13502 RepID=A0A875S5T6_EENNA|nr:uncharacterized protein FOA43_004080 [Brettanomyces nanus]QPG76686.1 hypothetical protein FOA43_004080 [Brettanomyces nanus]